MNLSSDALVSSYFKSFSAKNGNDIKPLSKNEEMRLFRRWKNKGDQAALDKLLLHNLKFVVRCANKLAYNADGKAIDINDLIQAGNEGLMHAVSHFKTSKKVRFVSYAYHWINVYIQNFIYANCSTVYVPKSNQTRVLMNRRWEVYSLTNGNDPEALEKWEKEFQKKYNTSKDLLKQEEAKIQTIVNQPSMDKPFVGSEGEETNLHDKLHDDECFNIFGLIAEKQEHELIKKKVRAALKQMDSRDRDILRSRFADDSLTLETIAKKYNLSRERVRQIELQALKKIKAKLIKSKAIQEIVQC